MDNSTQQQGTTQTVTPSGTTINAGALTACGVMANTFFNLTVNGIAMTGNTSEYYRNGWKDTTGMSYGGTNAYYTYAPYDSTITKYLYTSFEYNANHIITVPSSYAGFSIGYDGVNSTLEETGLSPLNTSQGVTMAEYGSLGQFVSGNFTGQMVRTRYDSISGDRINTVPVTMTFRVRHLSPPV